jgi:hypothetical protein
LTTRQDFVKHEGVGENRRGHAPGLIAVFLTQFLTDEMNGARVLVRHFIQQTSRRLDAIHIPSCSDPTMSDSRHA